jgi:8-oxo-dGTP pyrophosphatase MutT (NUDIX family)
LGLDDIFLVAKSATALRPEARDNPYFDVRIHEVHFPLTGDPSCQFFTIEHKFFASAVVCIDNARRVVMLRVPRFPQRNTPGDEWFWELPGGRNNAMETPLQCAQRELQEETGIVASSYEPLLKDYFYPESSFGTERLYLYVASDISGMKEQSPEPEGVLEMRWFELDEAVQMVFDGKIRSSWSIIGLLAARMRLQQILF